jgi:hypothetical protein
MKRSFRRDFALPFVLTAVLSPAARADTSPTTPKPKLPAADPGRPVDKDPAGHCWQRPPTPQCPPNLHCNPGPSTEVQCPPDKPSPKK